MTAPPFKHKCPFGPGAAGSGAAAVYMPFVPPDPSNHPVPSPGAKTTHNLACSAVREFTGSVLSHPSHWILKRLLGCQTSPPARHISPSAHAASEANQLKSSHVRSRRDPVRTPSVNDSGSASQGTGLSLCPFLTLKSPMGPGGCGKSEARSLLNSCVTEFPHNASMSGGTSRAQSTLG